MTRIFFATDIHGSDICFKKFINAGRFYGVDILILGGDITGKMVIPLIKNPDGTIETTLFGRDIRVESERELNELMKRISNIGYYPYYTTKKEMEELASREEIKEEIFKELMINRLKNWLEFAEEKLKGTKIKCYIQPGNDDIYEVDNILASSNIIINPEGKVVWIDDKHEMVSIGNANMTPWRCPRDIPEDKLKERITSLINIVENIENAILNIHPPPYDTEIDLAPMIDEEFNVVIRQGEIVYTHVGSKAVKEIIEEYQPLLGLHGHIHEARGVSRIGRTLCMNPGSEYTEGILRGVIIKLGKDKVKSYQFTSG
jgi:hypothetical protein